MCRFIGERGVGDFNHKIDLSRRGMFLHPSLVKNDIWLGFVEMLDANRPSGAHSVAIVSLVAEDFGKGVDQVLVVIPDGSHAKDLVIKEFDAFFWPENAGSRHTVMLIARKLPGSGFDGFGEKGLHRWLFNCAAWDGRNPVQKREMSATLRDRSPPRELIKRSGSMPLSWARARKRFKPSSRRWICPKSPRCSVPLVPSIFSRAKRYRIADAGPGGFQDGPGQRLTFSGTASMGGA